MKTQMPAINQIDINAAFDTFDFNINLDLEKVKQMVALIVGTRGEGNGRLRASKPKVTKGDYVQGCASYIWRYVAFYVSPNSQHHCMPVTDFFDLPGHYGDEMRALMKELDKVVDVIVNTVPKSERHGLNRWANAYGVGRPQYNQEGAVVYR